MGLLKDYTKLNKISFILSTVCFVLAIITKLGGFNLVGTPRSFAALTMIGLLFSANFALFQLLQTGKQQ